MKYFNIAIAIMVLVIGSCSSSTNGPSDVEKDHGDGSIQRVFHYDPMPFSLEMADCVTGDPVLLEGTETRTRYYSNRGGYDYKYRSVIDATSSNGYTFHSETTDEYDRPYMPTSASPYTQTVTSENMLSGGGHTGIFNFQDVIRVNSDGTTSERIYEESTCD